MEKTPSHQAGLKRRDFISLLSARFVSVLGSNIAPFALAFAAASIPAIGAAGLGVLVGAELFSRISFVLIGGALADRNSPIRTMIVGDILAFVAQMVMAVLIISGAATLPMLIPFAILNGIASALTGPSLTGVLPQFLPSEQLKQANIHVRTATTLARILAAPLAGGIILLQGPGLGLIIDASTFALSAFLLLASGIKSTRPRQHQNLLADVRDGWNEFRSRSWIWITVGSAGLINAARTAGITVLGPFVAIQAYNGAAGWSVILTAQTVGSMVSLFTIARLKVARPLIMIIVAGSIPAIWLAMLALQAPLVLVLLSAAATGAAISFYGIQWDTLLQQQLEPGVIARVSSYDHLGSYICAPIGAMLSGPLNSQLGLTATLLMWSGIVCGASLLAFLSRQVRTMGYQPPERLASPAGDL